MSRNYRPRRSKRIPPSAAEEWFGKLILGIMGVFSMLCLAAFVLGTLYVLFTTGIPKAYEAVVDWGDDVVTTVSDHNWQLTDGVLYVGIAVILVFRYTSVLTYFFSPYEGPLKEKATEAKVEQ